MGSPVVSGRRVLVVVALLVAPLAVVHERLTQRRFGAAVATLSMLTENTLPSVVELGEIRQLLDELRREIDHPNGRARLRARAASLWSELDGHLSSYLDRPDLPGEPELRARLLPALERLRDAQRAVLDAPDEDTAARLHVDRFAPIAHEVTLELQQLIELNARMGAAAAVEIERSYHRASEISTALTLAHLVSIGAIAAIAWRLASRAERILADRMTELDAFAGHAAHDLKGPLHAALLSCGLVRRTSDPERVTQALGLLEGGLRRAGHVVDGLLDFARSGARPQEGADVLVAVVVADLEPGLRVLAEAERAALSFHVEPGLAVAASRVALGSILENVVRNAILYLGDSPRRDVVVRASASGRRVRLSVADTGPGIPSDLRARLFRPFERGSERRGGTGLGLATVHRLVVAHAGSIAVESDPGRGTTVTLELPRRVPGEALPRLAAVA